MSLFLISALACCALPVMAKKKIISKTISGVVIDASGNPIAHATVELADKQTNKTIAIYTEDDGQYRFADLNPAHDYEVQARNQNQTSELRKLSSLDDRETIVVNLRIPPDQK